jgi:hydrophobe/amphiphile efflux-3 (HAE3) family protein
MVARLVEMLSRRRRAVGLVLIVVTGIAAFGAARLDFDFSPQIMFAGHGDMYEFSERLKQRFGYEDTLVLVVLEATGSADVLSPVALDWQARLGQRLSQVAHVERVLGLGNLKFPRVRLLGQNRVVMLPLIERWPVDAEGAERVREMIGQQPLVRETLLSPDYRAAMVATWIDPGQRTISSLTQVMREFRAAIAAEPLPEGYRLHIQGLPAMRTEVVEHLVRDQQRLVPVVVLLFFGLLVWMYRSAIAAMGPLIAAGVGLVWTIALLAWSHQSLNIVSNVLPVLLLIIGVSNCVHVMGRYGEESHADPTGGRRSAAATTIRHMIIPCLLTYLTTAIGFGSLYWGESPGLQAFGWQAALGMGVMYSSTILVLGVLLPLLPPPRPLDQVCPPFGWLTTAIAQATRHPRSYIAVIFLVTTVVIVASLLAGLKVPLDSRMFETYDDDHPTLVSLHFIEEKLGGFIPLEVSLTVTDAGRWTQPEVLRRVAEFQKIAAQQPEILLVRSYCDVLGAIHDRARPGVAALDDPLVSDEVAASRARRAARLAERMADNVGYRALLADDGLEARVLLRVRDVGSKQTLQLIDRLETILSAQFPADSGVVWRLTGDSYLNARAMDGFVRDMLSSLVGAAVIICGLIALFFRSLRLGLIAVIPNITPLVLMLGYLAWRGYDLNVANVIVFAISLGVAVDDTIHFLSRFNEEMASGISVSEAIRRVLRSAGETMILTTLLIVGGLSVFFLSDFLPTRRFAELTAVTMAAALVGDLVLLPACLLAFAKPRHAQLPAHLAD